jgi:hypothetical protein
MNEKLDMVYNYCITIWIKARLINESTTTYVLITIDPSVLLHMLD